MDKVSRGRSPVAWFLCLTLVLPLLARGQDEEDKTLRLPIGDARLKDRTMNVAAGEILAARTGKPAAFSRMIKELAGYRFVYVGESHDSLAMHDIQLQVIQALHAKSPDIAVGLEMLPLETQPVLDRWSQGLLSRDEFLRESRWYVHWSMNFGYYEKIFEFAKANRIPLYALNAPREVIAKVRAGGRDSLTEAEKEVVPPLDLGLEDHRALMRAIFGESDIPHEMKGGEAAFDKMFEGLYRAQVAWDEVMAANAIRGAEASKLRLVVLAGSGHMIWAAFPRMNLRAGCARKGWIACNLHWARRSTGWICVPACWIRKWRRESLPLSHGMACGSRCWVVISTRSIPMRPLGGSPWTCSKSICVTPATWVATSSRWRAAH